MPDLWFDVIWAIQRPYKDFRYWIRSHITRRWHIVDTHLKPAYYDKDALLLNACFALLVDYVELELPTCNGVHKRSREAGMEYLDWEINNTSGHQAESASVQKTLYLWWKDIRPTRPEADAEYSALWDRRDSGEKIPNDVMMEAAQRGGAIETQYYDEDSDMLKKLIEIRCSLWT